MPPSHQGFAASGDPGVFNPRSGTLRDSGLEKSLREQSSKLPMVAGVFQVSGDLIGAKSYWFETGASDESVGQTSSGSKA
jgi:hypothetical protein